MNPLLEKKKKVHRPGLVRSHLLLDRGWLFQYAYPAKNSWKKCFVKKTSNEHVLKRAVGIWV